MLLYSGLHIQYNFLICDYSGDIVLRNEIIQSGELPALRHILTVVVEMTVLKYSRKQDHPVRMICIAESTTDVIQTTNVSIPNSHLLFGSGLKFNYIAFILPKLKKGFAVWMRH